MVTFVRPSFSVCLSICPLNGFQSKLSQKAVADGGTNISVSHERMHVISRSVAMVQVIYEVQYLFSHLLPTKNVYNWRTIEHEYEGELGLGNFFLNQYI